jgi:hypothetical protein
LARLTFLTSFATSTFSFQTLGKSLVSPSGFWASCDLYATVSTSNPTIITQQSLSMSLGRRLGSPSGFLPPPFSTSTVFYQLSGQREIGPILLFNIHGPYTTLFTLSYPSQVRWHEQDSFGQHYIRFILSTHLSHSFSDSWEGVCVLISIRYLNLHFHASAYLHSLPIPLISSLLSGNGTGTASAQFHPLPQLSFGTHHILSSSLAWEPTLHHTVQRSNLVLSTTSNHLLPAIGELANSTA